MFSGRIFGAAIACGMLFNFGNSLNCYSCNTGVSRAECDSKKVDTFCGTSMTACYFVARTVYYTRTFQMGCTNTATCTRKDFCPWNSVDCELRCCTGDLCDAQSSTEVSNSHSRHGYCPAVALTALLCLAYSLCT